MLLSVFIAFCEVADYSAQCDRYNSVGIFAKKETTEWNYSPVKNVCSVNNIYLSYSWNLVILFGFFRSRKTLSLSVYSHHKKKISWKHWFVLDWLLFNSLIMRPIGLSLLFSLLMAGPFFMLCWLFKKPEILTNSHFLTKKKKTIKGHCWSALMAAWSWAAQ